MKIRNTAAFYSIFMGVSMIGMWLLFYVTDGIPEIYSKPIEIGLHIAAEMVTAIALIVGGIGLLSRRKWAFQVYLLSMGMLIYTLIVSPGYFAQMGQLAFIGMFALFIILALIFVFLSFLHKDGFES